MPQWIPIGFLLVTCTFDIIAGIISLKVAHQAQPKNEATADFVCDQNAFITTVLAIVTAHGLAHFVGGYDRNAWNVIKKWETGAIAILILVWCAFVVEFALLKHSHGKKKEEACVITHPKELFGVGIACFVHIAFTFVLYLSMLKPRKASLPIGTTATV